MDVITKRYLTSTNVYHTERCHNARQIKHTRTVTEARAKELGLSKCVWCADEPVEQTRRRKSLRYQIARGEVDLTNA